MRRDIPFFKNIVVAWCIASCSLLLAGMFGVLWYTQRNALQPSFEPRYAVPTTSHGSPPSSFRDIVNAVVPSVVTISSVQTGDGSNSTTRPPFFDFFFGLPDGDELPNQERRSQGFGSGVVVERSGDTYYVITNAHVIGNADEITVMLSNGDEIDATVVGSDVRKDLALISFVGDGEDIPVATLGDSDDLYVGDWVLAIGSPFNFQSTVTAGIVSALGRRGGPQGNINDFIQTDAAINQGNSGGALINTNGEVIGINTWISSRTGTNIGLGFAIPINNVKKPIQDFISQGKVEYGWLGVSISTLTDDLVESMGTPDDRGAWVLNVFQDSPADKAGILPGDFIVSINGVVVENSDELLLIVGDLEVGKRATFELYRQREPMSITVRITTRDTESNISSLNSKLWPGMRVAPLTGSVIDRLELDNDVTGVYIVNVEDRTPVAIAGLRTGDVIVSVNDKPIEGLLSFYQALNNMSTDEVKFRYMRQGQTLSIGIER